MHRSGRIPVHREAAGAAMAARRPRAQAALRSFRSWVAPGSADGRYGARGGSPRAVSGRMRRSGRTARMPKGNHGQGATTRALTRPLSTSFLSRVSTKIPCWGCCALGYKVVKVRICTCSTKCLAPGSNHKVPSGVVNVRSSHNRAIRCFLGWRVSVAELPSDGNLQKSRFPAITGRARLDL